MARVFITIVTYQGREYVEDLFESLRTEISTDCGVIVVDNASTDTTADWIAEYAPTVELIRSATNTGFTGGQNLAMRRAIARGAEYVVLLNQDMVVSPGVIQKLVDVADRHHKAATIQPLVMLYGTKDPLVNSWGNAQHYLGFGYAGGYKRPLSEAPTQITPITYASGAAVLYRVSVLKEIGLFSEHFFMYQEDLDMSWRMRLAGHELLLAPEAHVFHKYNWQGAAKKYALVERNRLATICANYHWATLLLLAPGLVFAELGLLASALVTGWFWKKIESYRLFFSAPYQKGVRASRAHAQSLRAVSDREATAPLTAIIAFQETKSPITRYILNPCFWLYWTLVRSLMFW